MAFQAMNGNMEAHFNKGMTKMDEDNRGFGDSGYNDNNGNNDNNGSSDNNSNNDNNGYNDNYYNRNNGYGGGNFYDSSKNEEGNGNKGISIASLVCGILSLICCCGGWLGLILAAAAIVLGVISIKNNYDGRELAIAGLITGGCGLLLAIVMLIFAAIAAGLSSDFLRDGMEYYNLDDIYDIL